MLRKLLAAVSRGPDAKVIAGRRLAELPPNATQLEQMVPLRPQPAQHTDRMHGVCEVVEKALREAGHLR